MAIIIKKKIQPEAVITTIGNDKQLTMKTEKVGNPIDVPEPHATVGFQAQRKFSDGKYGSYSVGVSLFWPCKLDALELETTFAHINTWVDLKLQALLKDTPGE